MSDQRKLKLNFGLDRFSGLYLWAIFIIAFGFWVPKTFLTMATVHSLASQDAVVAILAVAVLLPLAAGTYDLSVGANINVSTIICIQLQSVEHWNMWASIIVAILSTTVIGVINGFVVVVLKVNSFIATLGMATIVGAAQVIVTNGTQPLPPLSTKWSSLTQTSFLGGFQVVIIYLVVIAAVIWWLLEYTPAGRYLFAIGGNPEASRLAGIRVGTWTWLSLIGSGFLTGIAGVLYGSLTGPSLSYGAALLLPAFAAVFLGSTQIKGRFNVIGTLIAIYALATGVKGLQLVTGEQWINDMMNGVALIAAVAFALWRQRISARRPAAATPAETEELNTHLEPPGAFANEADSTPSPALASSPDRT